MPVQTAIQTRRGTASSWTSTNPTLAAGEIGFETDTGKFKIGTGSTAWASLPYAAIDAGLLAAKGDLVTATANDTPAVLTVGSNGETLVADSSTSTGLRYNPQNALANPVINGGLDVWQRGTSFVGGVTSAFIGPDRWNTYRSVSGSTFTRQTTSDTTNLPNIQYCARVQRDSGNTSTVPLFFFQDFETVNSLPFAGKTVTFSFYARKGANYSSANDFLNALLITGTGTDQSQRAGYTNQNSIISQNAVLTTSWQRFAYTATVGSTATQLGIQFTYTPSGTAGANDYFEVTGVQVDLGTYTASSAPTFRRSGGTLAGELAACQRYYVRLGANSGNTYTAYAPYASGYTASTTEIIGIVTLPVSMRVRPTSIEYANLAFRDSSGFFSALGAMVSTHGSQSIQELYNGGLSGLTANRPGDVRNNNNTSGYLAFNAEL